MLEPGSDDIRMAAELGDCHLHVKCATLPAAKEHGQGRGNSGVFLMYRYEVQILENHESPSYADRYAGAVCGQRLSTVNACREFGTWQTCDVVWTAPQLDGGELVARTCGSF
jgi:hypothetical protein